MDRPDRPPIATPRISAAVIGLVAAVVASAAGFALGRSTAPRPGWPTYAAVFDQVAAGVVNVSVEGPSTRVGSGFAVSADQVVTAGHLVTGPADQVWVRDIDGRTLPAAVVGTDARTDLALLEVPGAGFSPVALGGSDRVRVGDTVIAIGNPYGLSHSLAVGVVGGRGRRLASEAVTVDFLQLSMPLNPGNSGGPVFDTVGRVIGVLSGTHAQGQAIAFAVPVEALVAGLPALRAGRRVSRAFLGVQVGQEGESVVVTGVIPSSPGDRAGIRPGDRLSAFGGDAVRATSDLDAALDRYEGGARVTVRLLRDGQLRVVDVALADWAEQPVVIGGMTLRPAPGAGGEVVAVRPRSRAEKAGIAVGDVVRSVDGVPVRAPADIRDALAGGSSAQLDVVRGGVPVAVQLGESG
ncbi:MAG: trypsin-like peptidase domain-containing protein [Myxococcota bacterium]